MTDEIKKRYDQALRFDEGDLRFTEIYLQSERTLAKIEAQTEAYYGPEVLSLLQKYAETLYDIAELEGMHYFEQGYLAGQ